MQYGYKYEYGNKELKNNTEKMLILKKIKTVYMLL